MGAMPATAAAVLDAPAAEAPDRVALIAPDRTLTYAELDDDANRAARALIDLGLVPGDRLAVRLPNDSRIVVLFHAAMRRGAVWVGLNATLSLDEMQAIVDDCRPTVVVGAAVRAGGARTLSLEEWDEAFAAAAPTASRAMIDPFAVAAIAYTSGTTGRPKGVVHSQHNLLVPGAVLVADRRYDSSLRKADSLPLTILNMHVLSTLLTPQAGGTAVISDIRDARRVSGWLEETGANVWNGVPTQLYDLARDDAIDGTTLRGLREVWSGGDNLSEQIRSEFEVKFGVPICATYGLTEAPSIVSIEAADGTHEARSSGRVLPHLAVSVRDVEGRLSPTGELGEICLSSVEHGEYAHFYRPMLGYWRAAGETDAALAGDVVHTGDVGLMSADRQLFIFDRRKLMFVRGGANIYPAEIEQVLQRAPGVLAACVFAVPDERLGARVGAVVQVASPRAPTEQQLAVHCGDQLAKYKVPDQWYLTAAALPRNSMGKLNRPQVVEIYASADIHGGAQ